MQRNMIAELRRGLPETGLYCQIWAGQPPPNLPSGAPLPHLCVTLLDHRGKTLEQAQHEAARERPPFLVVEIISPNAPAADLLARLHDFAAIGVPNIWMLDTRRRIAFAYTAHCLEEITGDTISTTEPIIQLHLADVFRGL
jgi:Uma2 family endonuclease